MESTHTKSKRVDVFGRFIRYCAAVAGIVAVLCFTLTVEAEVSPITTCEMGGIGSTELTADVPGVEITGVSEGTTSNGVPYCLVKVLVPEAINIWVGLPTDGHW